ncbi:hypothetical protein BU15DRAFT_70796 [Melanogaster broomeanus]|nr:hypothetical protein BU15DRAFT_70796 [Melanogaster broomeanus]
MGAISIIRIAVLASSTLFSIVVLGLAAHILSLTQQYLGSYFYFSALGIAAGVLSMVTLPLMVVLDFYRRGAFTSMIVVELVWLFILWVLWVATAAEAAVAVNFFFPFGCIYPEYPVTNQACHEMQATEAFSFLIFIILLVYTILLLISALVAASRGNGVWLSSVKESTFFRSSDSPVQPLPMVRWPQYTGSTVPSQQPHPPAGRPQAFAV